MTIVLRMVSVLALAAPYTMLTAQVATPASAPRFICKGGAAAKQVEQTWRCPDNSLATSNVTLGAGGATTHAANTVHPPAVSGKQHGQPLGGGSQGVSASVQPDQPAHQKEERKAAKARANVPNPDSSSGS